MTQTQPKAQARSRRQRLARGFSMIEVMVTIAIIAIMVAMASVSFGASVKASRERGAVSKLTQDFTWARTAAGTADASILNASLSGSPVLTMVVRADCTWTTAINGTTDAAHSMTSSTLATIAPSASCTATGMTLPATFTFTPEGFVNTTGKLTFVGNSGQDFPLQILYSGAMLRVKNAT